MNTKEKKYIRTKNIWPTISLVLFLTIFISSSSPCLAEGSGYFDVPEHGRPLPAYSICCCEKDKEDGSQSSYNCKLVEEEKCPVNTKNYNVSSYQCPSTLIINK